MFDLIKNYFKGIYSEIKELTKNKLNIILMSIIILYIIAALIYEPLWPITYTVSFGIVISLILLCIPTSVAFLLISLGGFVARKTKYQLLIKTYFFLNAAICFGLLFVVTWERGIIDIWNIMLEYLPEMI
jgi:hypothetical protein